MEILPGRGLGGLSGSRSRTPGGSSVTHGAHGRIAVRPTALHLSLGRNGHRPLGLGIGVLGTGRSRRRLMRWPHRRGRRRHRPLLLRWTSGDRRAGERNPASGRGLVPVSLMDDRISLVAALSGGVPGDPPTTCSKQASKPQRRAASSAWFAQPVPRQRRHRSWTEHLHRQAGELPRPGA